MPYLGVDAGALKKDGTSRCWCARLKEDFFELHSLDLTVQPADLRGFWDSALETVAVDAPQGLPASGFSRRRCDCEANTPTRVLPSSRALLAEGSLQLSGKPYPLLGLVRFGCNLFWANREHICGLNPSSSKLIETYPRAILLRWIEVLGKKPKEIPSKKKHSKDYVSFASELLRNGRFRWATRETGVEINKDHCDAMLCALAAKAHVEGKADLVGEPPTVDEHEEVIREGYIVLPQVQWLKDL